jgi:hypothetical protein
MVDAAAAAKTMDASMSRLLKTLLINDCVCFPRNSTPGRMLYSNREFLSSTFGLKVYIDSRVGDVYNTCAEKTENTHDVLEEYVNSGGATLCNLDREMARVMRFALIAHRTGYTHPDIEFLGDVCELALDPHYGAFALGNGNFIQEQFGIRTYNEHPDTSAFTPCMAWKLGTVDWDKVDTYVKTHYIQ